MNPRPTPDVRRIPPPPGWTGPTPPRPPAKRARTPRATVGKIRATGTPGVVTRTSGGFLVTVPARWTATTRDDAGEPIDRREVTGMITLAATDSRDTAELLAEAFRAASPLVFDGRPPKALTPAEAEAFVAMPPDVRAVLEHIAATRMLTGEGPKVNALWSLWHHGDLDHPARHVGTDRSQWIVSKLDGRERPPKADARHLLSWLAAEWFVRFGPDTGSVKVRGIVYQLLRPQVVARLTEQGQWPPPRRERYSGPKRVRDR